MGLYLADFIAPTIVKSGPMTQGLNCSPEVSIYTELGQEVMATLLTKVRTTSALVCMSDTGRRKLIVFFHFLGIKPKKLRLDSFLSVKEHKQLN